MKRIFWYKFEVYVTIRCSCPLIPVQFPFINMPNELSIEGSMSKLNVKIGSFLFDCFTQKIKNDEYTI